MSYTNEEMLEAFGFTKIEGNLWSFQKEFSYTDLPKEFDESKRIQRAVVIVDLADEKKIMAYVPWKGEDAPVKTDAIPEEGLSFKTADIRDVIALAQNEIASVMSETTGFWPDDGFSDDARGFFITEPFMSGDYFDYALAKYQPKKSPHTALRNPAVYFKDLYTSWRDEFCEKILATANAPKM